MLTRAALVTKLLRGLFKAAAVIFSSFWRVCILQDARQEFTIERLQHLYDELRRELPPRRKRPSSLTVVDSVGHDDSGSKPHWCALPQLVRQLASSCRPLLPSGDGHCAQ
jgi:hypothetical protein